jgi:hypothetical protein
MAEEKEKRESPRTQPGAPAKPAGPTTEAPRRGAGHDDDTAPKRHHVSDDSDAGGDLMPKGFDEPGAGI